MTGNMLDCLKVNKCCFCLDLRAGSISIGLCYALSMVGLIANIISRRSVDAVFAAAAAARGAGEVTSGDYLVGVLVQLPAAIIMLAFSIALIVGVQRNLPRYVRAFMIYIFIYLIVYVTTQMYLIVNYPDFTQIFLFIIFTGLTSYFLLVIWNFYPTMRKSAPHPSPHFATACA